LRAATPAKTCDWRKWGTEAQVWNLTRSIKLNMDRASWVWNQDKTQANREQIEKSVSLTAVQVVKQWCCRKRNC
jgi:hypothetical protein